MLPQQGRRCATRVLRATVLTPTPVIEVRTRQLLLDRGPPRRLRRPRPGHPPVRQLQPWRAPIPTGNKASSEPCSFPPSWPSGPTRSSGPPTTAANAARRNDITPRSSASLDDAPTVPSVQGLVLTGAGGPTAVLYAHQDQNPLSETTSSSLTPVIGRPSGPGKSRGLAGQQTGEGLS